MVYNAFGSKNLDFSTQSFLIQIRFILTVKLKEFQHYLIEKDIDLALFIYPDVNLTYFTQFKPSTTSFLVVWPEAAEFYLTQLDDKPKLKRIAVKILAKGWDKKLQDKKVKKIGINKETFTLAQKERFHKIFPKAKFIDVSSKVKELKELKTSEEIKKISQACKITINAFQELILALEKRKLHTEREVALFLDQAMCSQEAEIAFPTVAAMGKSSAIPHYCTGNEKLKRGFLLLDFGARYQNYNADCSRMIFLGQPNKEELQMYNLLKEVQEQTILQIVEKKSLGEVDKFSRKGLGKYSSHFIHSLGHGVGLEVHEAPSLFPESAFKVKDGQVFTIESGIYFPGKYGLRIEYTLVFDGKVRILTNSSKELVKIRI